MDRTPAAVLQSDSLPACCLGTITVHNEHHVFWVVHGSATLMADGRTYHLRALEALWLPAGTVIDQIMTGPDTVALTVLLPVDAFPQPSATPVQRKITSEFSLLLLHLYGRWRMQAWGNNKMSSEVADIVREGFFPGPGPVVERPRMPVSTPAVAVARQLIDRPGESRTREEWAERVGLSARQLTRLFRSETGLSFSAWRTTLKMAVAAERAASGEPVRCIASRLGYSGVSALSHAFRGQTGQTLSSLARCAYEPPVERKVQSLPDLSSLIPADRRIPMINNFHVCIVVLRGSCRVFTPGKTIEIRDRQLLWLAAGVRHELLTDPGTVVIPVGPLPAAFPMDLRNMDVIDISADDEIATLYRSGVNYTRLRPYRLSGENMEDLLPAVVRLRAKKHGGKLTPVGRIFDSDLRSQRSIGDWAKELGWNVRALSRIFEEATGQSYRDWIVDRRMSEAVRILERPEWRISEVAASVGYSSTAAFVRAFKDRVGITPGQYHRRYRFREIYDLVE